MRFGLYIIGLVGCVFALPALWSIVDEIRFGAEARVAPGTFSYYASRWSPATSSSGSINRGPSRGAAGSSGSNVTASAEALYPVFRLTVEDGDDIEVFSEQSHAFRYFERGEPVEVLVHPDPERTPRIDSALARYVEEAVWLLVGTGIAVLAGVGLVRAPPDNSVRAARPYIIGVTVFVLLFVVVGTIGGILTGEFTWEELLRNQFG